MIAAKQVSNKTLAFVLVVACALALSGCGGTQGGKRQDDFFTSGSREADQRATQRMAKAEQLSGSGEGAAEKGSKTETGEGQSGTNEIRQTLFERLGGEQALTALVDDFVKRAIADPRVNWERRSVDSGGIFSRKDNGGAWNPTPENVNRVKTHIVQFLALATGGPAKYDGKEMKAAHAGMKITNAEFDAAIGDLKASLDKLNVPSKEQKELLAIVESTRPQIVSER